MPPLSAGMQPRLEAAPVSLEPASSWEPQDADKDLRDSSPLFPALERSLAYYTWSIDGLGNQGFILFQTLMGKALRERRLHAWMPPSSVEPAVQGQWDGPQWVLPPSVGRLPRPRVRWSTVPMPRYTCCIYSARTTPCTQTPTGLPSPPPPTPKHVRSAPTHCWGRPRDCLWLQQPETPPLQARSALYAARSLPCPGP